MKISSILGWLRRAFNPRELPALAFLSSSLAVGVIVTVIERSDPERFAGFSVIEGAVSPPAPVGLAVAGGPGLVLLNSVSAADLDPLTTHSRRHLQVYLGPVA